MIRGIRNFHQVNDHVYRGAQPSEQGFQALAQMGVQTVVDLRRDGENHEHFLEDEARLVEAAGMRYVSVPMQGVVAPSNEQIARVLAVLNSGERVFVHCREGKDRTGAIIACYRITHDKWSRPSAIQEANGYGMHWYEVGLRTYVMQFREEDLTNTRSASQRTESSEPVTGMQPSGIVRSVLEMAGIK